MIKDYRNIDAYIKATRLGVERAVEGFLLYRYEELGEQAQLSQNTYRQHFFELSFEINASCSFQIDGFAFAPQSNRLTVVAPRRLQSLLTQQHLPPKGKGCTVFFEADFWGEHLHEGNLKKDFDFLRPDVSPAFQLSDKAQREIANIFDLMQYEQQEYGDKGLTTIRHLTRILFEKIKNLEKAPQEAYHKRLSPLVSEFLYLCATSFLHLHTVKQYAEQLSITPKYLSEVVKAQTGKSALDTIHYFKLGYAKGLLRQSRLSVKQIALELGYENPEYFNVFFKKETGMTPNQFRQI